MRAGYYKLLITSLMPKEICRRCANAGAVCVPRPPSKHFGSGINVLSICEDSETGCLPLKYIPPSGIIYIQVNSLTPAQESGAATLQPCAHTMMVDGDPQRSSKRPRLHDIPHMTTPRRRDDKHVVGIIFIQYVNGNRQMSGADEPRWRPDVSQLRNIY